MFGFGRNKDKAKFEVETAKGGSLIKRARLLVGISTVVAAIKFIESLLGYDYFPDEMEKEVAEVVLAIIGLVAAVMAQRSVKPAVVQAADATGQAAEDAKADAGVK